MASGAGLAKGLRKRFETLLRDPDAYARRVRDECEAFPEGDLFPWTFPVAGFVNATLADPSRAAGDRARCEQLLAPAVEVVGRRLGIARASWNRLTSYRGEGVYAGQLALALAGYRRIGGTRWDDVHERLCAVLHDALDVLAGRPLLSFTGVCWPFDTIPAVVALHLRDSAGGRSQHARVVRRHLEWIERSGTDPAFGLPWSRVDPEDGRGLDPPRGCELPWRFVLMSHVDRGRAAKGYRDFCRHFWRDLGILAGFAEWPRGHAGGSDADSGPILLGVGLSATGFGLGAALLVRDRWRWLRLCGQLGAGPVLFPLLRPALEQVCPFRAEYLTGMLMGDAALFGTVATRDWTGGPLADEPSRAAPDRRVLAR